MLHPLKSGLFEIISLSSFDALCHGNVPAGQQYYDAVKSHSKAMGQSYLTQNADQISDNTVILYIPRGGEPTGKGLRDAFLEAAQPKNIQTRVSQTKTTPNQLYPDDTFRNASTLIIADGIIGTGKTIVDHLNQIPATWNGRIEIFANAASELGLRTIGAAIASVPQPVHGVIGRIFDDNECEWVDIPGKKVYFVGYNKARGLDYQLPDFGDHINVHPPTIK